MSWRAWVKPMFRGRRPEGTIKPLALWAFWPYDRFPYLLSGRVLEQTDEGKVKVEGYNGMVFRPVFLASGASGERLHNEVRRVAAAYRIHEECARNGAGNAAHEHLLKAGLPPGALMKLKQTGWQGSAYEELFRAQIKQEGL